MAKKHKDRVANMVAEVERAAKHLRADVRKRVKERPMLRALQKAADRLRERAAAAAGQMEKYVHQLRMELEGAPAAKRAVRRR
jgi:ElaB/YqjD/DUF883 family membrane-anchored ribosome-binding protein